MLGKELFLWLIVGVSLIRKRMDIRRELLKCEVMDNLILNLRGKILGLGLVEFEEIK